MANTYYDSELTAQEIENALEAIDGVIAPANNGKVLAVENGKIIAKSVVWPGANMQSKTVTPDAAGQTVEPDSGYDGLSSVTINGDADLVAGNIKKDVNIFGVTGSYEGGTPILQSKTVTPGASQQTVQPDSGYDGLSSVVVNGDADLVAGNIKKDVEIFGVTGSYEGSGGSTLITKSITQNGTYNASSDNADGYSQVTVNVSGGGGNSKLCEIDFTKGNFTCSGVTIGSTGAVFDSASDYLLLPFARSGMTVEIDVVEMQLTSGTHRRFIMATPTNGFIYRSTGVWAFYNGSWVDSNISDPEYFKNSTVKIEVDNNNYWHIYKDETLVWEPSLAQNVGLYNFNSAITGNGIFSIGSYSGQGLLGTTIKAVRIY